ncbi:hypothetical protein CBQ26_01840 [Deinococcus indicus]|uniref:PRTRC system protein B n=2 Tax=Deinococcus indicus TaxID=223556 RepID=A0A246BTC6_9DEIO|nr:hypothetical protein CBQ26_01840 [Deinococcus indicus]
MSATMTISTERTQRAAPALHEPVLALVLYAPGGQDGLNSAYTRKHRIRHDSCGRAVLGAAQALTREDARDLLMTLGGRALTPTRENTLATSPTACAWWIPAGERALLFNPKYAQAGSVARFSGQSVPHPPLVFIAGPGSLSVYALRENTRPTLETPVCHAPFWNIFPSGQVCRGSTTYPQACTPDTQADWEEVFFQSEFTGPSRTDRYMNWGRSYEELLDTAQAQGTFPADVLVNAGKTLAQLLT